MSQQAKLRPIKVVSMRRLRWLRHLARMEGNRIRKQLLFVELLSTQLHHGTLKRWRDNINGANYLKDRDLIDWYGVAQKRPDWRPVCNTVQSSASVDVPTPLLCLCRCVSPLTRSNSPLTVGSVTTVLEHCWSVCVCVCVCALAQQH